MNQKVIVVEDDEDINHYIARCLSKESFDVTSAYSGTEARLLCQINSFDLMILDLMLPGVSGEVIIEEIREKSNLPIIVISAKVSLEDKVKVLRLGADDYMTKPFEKDELLARVEAVMRRMNHAVKTDDKECLLFKNLRLSLEERAAYLSNQDLNLTASEFDILYLLVKHKDKAYTKEQIYEQVWKDGYYGEDNTISVHISNIRKKIKQFDEASYIKTVWGIGFKMDTAL